MDSIRLEIGYDFVPLAKKEVPNLISEIAALRGRLESEDQLLLPAVRVRDSVDLAGLEFRIFIHESESARGEANSDAEAVSEAVSALKTCVLEHRSELATRHRGFVCEQSVDGN